MSDSSDDSDDAMELDQTTAAAPTIEIPKEKSAEEWKNIGNEKYKIKDYKMAIESYSKAIALDITSGEVVLVLSMN